MKNNIAINPKKCNCCNKTHHFAPITAINMSGLLWWNCNCDSTICYEIDKLKDFIKIDKVKTVK